MLLKHQPWHTPSESGKAITEFEWNMWGRRLWPLDELKLGDAVMTVTAGGRTRGRVMNEVRVLEMAKGYYETHEQAWDLILAHIDERELAKLGHTRKTFLEHDYTWNAPRVGWLLAWLGEPELIIDKPRPVGLTFNQNGWAEISRDEVFALYDGAIELLP
jgi:hypothetical protein